MSTQPNEFDRLGPPDNTFEEWARALSEFVIRTTILPITILLAKPSAVLRAGATGRAGSELE